MNIIRIMEINSGLEDSIAIELLILFKNRKKKMFVVKL